jgi:hypothetical protein
MMLPHVAHRVRMMARQRAKVQRKMMKSMENGKNTMVKAKNRKKNLTSQRKKMVTRTKNQKKIIIIILINSSRKNLLLLILLCF